MVCSDYDACDSLVQIFAMCYISEENDQLEGTTRESGIYWKSLKWMGGPQKSKHHVSQDKIAVQMVSSFKD